MNLRTLGSSGLLVSPICLGTMTFGSPVGESDSIQIVHHAIDRGINFIDTANVYEGYKRFLGSPGGVAEEIVGKALRDRRDKMILATKVAAPVGPGPQDRGLTAVHILREVDRSLKRLQTDYIDLYIAHWPDRFVPLETTLQAMDIATRQGKIRYFGASNHYAWQMCEYLWLAERTSGPRLVSAQIPYSLLRRELHHDLAFCQKHRIGVTPYQSLQGGLLTGKYRRGQPLPSNSRASEKPEWIWKMDQPLFDRLERLEAIAQRINAPLSQLSLAWTLTQPAMSSLVVGVKGNEQLNEAIAAASLQLADDELKEIDAICPAPWQHPDPVRG